MGIQDRVVKALTKMMLVMIQNHCLLPPLPQDHLLQP